MIFKCISSPFRIFFGNSGYYIYFFLLFVFGLNVEKFSVFTQIYFFKIFRNFQIYLLFEKS